jgi:hypothetical protein
MRFESGRKATKFEVTRFGLEAAAASQLKIHQFFAVQISK